MESKNEAPTYGERKSVPGGLLANVSLLTTGGSSLQQLTNNDLQLTTSKNNVLHSAAAGTPSDHNIVSKTSSESMKSSTPARVFSAGNIAYGFDLSPVHSYEMPTAAHSKQSLRGSKSDNDVSRFSLQTHLEEQLFANDRSAPNFMQAPSVTSSHQSRLSVRKSDDAETMMSQVYSPSEILKKSHSKAMKKTTKTNKSPSTSPNRVSPRKSSKRYSHVQGSGYGITSPWKSSTKSKPKEKPKTPASSKKKPKSKSGSSEFLSDSALKLLANMKDNKDNAKFYSKFEKVPLSGKTFKVSSPKQTELVTASIEERKIPKPSEAEVENLDFQPEEKEEIDVRQSLEYQTLKDRCGALEEECEKLKVGNEEAHKENFLLTAKLNKLVAVNESTDAVIKDSLNEDVKDTEIMKLKKEIFEQERLLTGYQQENEKLYRELAKFKIQQRENENAMYKENLKLKSKLASLNEELNEKDAVIRDKNQLLLNKEYNRRPSVNVSAQTLEESPLRASSVKSDAKKDQLIANLEQKLSTYTEDKNLLHDRELKLGEANEDIRYLKEEVAGLQRELTTLNSKSKQEESKMVEDLKRQVKELEICLVRAQGNDHVQDLLHGNKEKVLLEERCQQLETRLKIQEEQFSNNMRSLHNLYKNMSKDYEERVNTLSEQLQLVKKHQVMGGGGGCFIEDHQRIIQENDRLKLQIERLNQDLMDERKNAANKTYSKPKRKTHSQNTESTYNPGHFVQRPPVKSLEEKPSQQTNISNKVEELSIEKESLLKQVVQWKNMYEDAKKIEESREAEIDKVLISHKKAMNELDSDKSILQEKLTTIQAELSKSNANLLSSQAREDALQIQIRNLLDELQETRKASPNAAVRQLEAIQGQIRMLDFRQKSREDQLNRVVAASADEYLKAEITSLHKTISEKNILISKFQCELDAILRVLETLQKSKR